MRCKLYTARYRQGTNGAHFIAKIIEILWQIFGFELSFLAIGVVRQLDADLWRDMEYLAMQCGGPSGKGRVRARSSQSTLQQAKCGLCGLTWQLTINPQSNCQCSDANLNPITPARIKAIQTSLTTSRASSKSHIPSNAVPAAPIPVQTA